MNEKAAIYIRVSTHWQVDKDSLQVQKRELQAYCEMILNIHDYEIFEDAGYSAKNTDRPAYQQMVRRLRNGEFSHLVVWKIDRISRNILDFAAMYSELKSLGVVFVSKNEQFDTSSAIGEAMLKIILVFAELERNMTAERVTAVMLSRAVAGSWNGGKIPYGYVYENGVFSFNNGEKQIVEYIFTSCVSGKTFIDICRDLNSRKIYTRQNKEWTPPSVGKILHSEFYVGNYVYNKHDENENRIRPRSEWITIQNHHPAIISKQMFDYAQTLIGSRRPAKTRRVRNVHLFSGLVKCGVCGGNMIAMTNGSRTADWKPSRYFCAIHRQNISICANPSTSDVVLAPVIFRLVGNILEAQKSVTASTRLSRFKKQILEGLPYTDIPDEDIKELLSASNATGDVYHPLYEAPAAEYTALISEKRRIETALTRLKTLYLYSEESMSEAEYIAEQKTLIDRLAEIEPLLSEAPPQSDIKQEMTYKIMAGMLMDKTSDFRKFLAVADRNIPKAFFQTILDHITSTGGKVTEVSFKNGITLHLK